MSGRSGAIGSRLRSVRHAIRGIAVVLRTQRNARIHLAATVIVIGAGLAFGLDVSEWLWIAVAITIVWAAEGFNTALELVADAVSPEPHPGIGRAKDVAAGAVLIAAVGAAVIGILVLGPHVARAVL